MLEKQELTLVQEHQLGWDYDPVTGHKFDPEESKRFDPRTPDGVPYVNMLKKHNFGTRFGKKLKPISLYKKHLIVL